MSNLGPPISLLWWILLIICYTVRKHTFQLTMALLNVSNSSSKFPSWLEVVLPIGLITFPPYCWESADIDSCSIKLLQGSLLWLHGELPSPSPQPHSIKIQNSLHYPWQRNQKPPAASSCMHFSPFFINPIFKLTRSSTATGSVRTTNRLMMTFEVSNRS